MRWSNNRAIFPRSRIANEALRICMIRVYDENRRRWSYRAVQKRMKNRSSKTRFQRVNNGAENVEGNMGRSTRNDKIVDRNALGSCYDRRFHRGEAESGCSEKVEFKKAVSSKRRLNLNFCQIEREFFFFLTINLFYLMFWAAIVANGCFRIDRVRWNSGTGSLKLHSFRLPIGRRRRRHPTPPHPTSLYAKPSYTSLPPGGVHGRTRNAVIDNLYTQREAARAITCLCRRRWRRFGWHGLWFSKDVAAAETRTHTRDPPATSSRRHLHHPSPTLDTQTAPPSRISATHAPDRRRRREF